MKNKWLIIAGVTAAVAITTTVQAIPITGEIDMSGTATLDTANLATANAATSITLATTGGTLSGSFAAVTPGDFVNWNGFGWNPQSVPAGSLWSFTDAGVLYSFELNSVVKLPSSNASFLNLLGGGTLSISGGVYDDTPGLWSFTISNPTGGDHANFKFTFANSQVSTGKSVPDGGLTVAMLGLAFAGVAGLRRKLVKQ